MKQKQSIQQPAPKKDEDQVPNQVPEQQGPGQQTSQDPKDVEIRELTNTLQRLQAEFENFRKWTEKDNRERTRFSNAQLIARFLPLLDTFDAALKTPKEKDSAFAKGIGMLHSQLLALLHGEGLKQIICVGKKCDPHYHDVMLKEKSDKEEGTILEEFQKGYTLHDKILRHSKVKISG